MQDGRIRIITASICSLRGRLGSIPVFLFLVTVLPCGISAEAARLTLLRISNIGQSIGGGYGYSSSKSTSSTGESTSSTIHNSGESYGISGSFSLLTPRLINGSASLNFNLTQQKQSDQSNNISSSSQNIGYNISAVILDAKPYTSYINASRQTSTITSSFIGSYETKSENLNMGLDLKNRFLPTRFDWTRNFVQTSGLDRNYAQVITTASSTMAYTLGISSFGLGLSRSSGQSTDLTTNTKTTSTSHGANITNTFGWNSARGLSRLIINNYNYNKSIIDSPETTQRAASSLQWKLGKALHAAANYSYSTRTTPRQDYQQENTTLTVSHQLYESLSTSLNLSQSNGQFNDGSQKGYGGGIGIGYRKKLPEQSQINTSYSFSYSLSDRSRENFSILVEGEPHDIPPDIGPPRTINLVNPLFTASSIIVKGAFTNLTYQNGLDYIVGPLGIEVLAGKMPGDTKVLITYSYRQDPRVTFASYSHSAGARLALFNGRHLIYTNYQTSSQKLLKGEATDVTLTPSQHFVLGFESNMEKHSFGAEYGWNKSAASDLQYLNAHWKYQTAFASGTLTSFANERFTMHSGSGQGGSSTWDNFFSLRSTYNRTLIRNIMARLGLSYINTYSDTGTMANAIAANLGVDGRIGKTMLSLNSSFSLTKSDSTMTRTQSAGVSATRFF